jgi:hypothetical protein
MEMFFFDHEKEDIRRLLPIGGRSKVLDIWTEHLFEGIKI